MTVTASKSDSIASGMDDIPRNQWYVAAGREEIGRQLLARRILNIPIVFYRTENGDPVALLDRCPHRFLPLSQGRLIGNEVQCGYHGFRYGTDGICTKIPTQSNIPPQIRVSSYPLVEKGIWTWIWLGDPAKADVSLIPDPGYIKPGQVGMFDLCYPIKCGFLWLHENLMDTSHPTFLHPVLFDDGELAAAPFRVETKGSMVRVIRETPDYVINPEFAPMFSLEPGARIRRILITETHAPSLNTIFNRFVYSDDPTRPPIDIISELPITPGGPGLCYHFMGSFWSFNMTNEQRRGFLEGVVRQDAAALETIWQTLDEVADTQALSVRADQGALKLRRTIQMMAAAERQ